MKVIKRKKKGLTDRELVAINAYFLNGFNKTQAMKTAGYAHPSQQATFLFARPRVVAEIEKRRQAVAKKYDVTHERVLEELAMIGFSRLGDAMETDGNGNSFINMEKLGDKEKAALAELTVDEYAEGRGDGKRKVIKTKIKLHDKKGALDSLARILGMFNDKLKIEGEVSLAERLQRGRKRLKQSGDE